MAENYERFDAIISELLDKIKAIVNDEYEMEILLEEWACQLRAKGAIYEYNVYQTYYQKDKISEENAEVKGETALTLAEIINRHIKILNRHINGCTRIVIDKLVNPLEILYLRERYSTFFLIAINSDTNTTYPRKILSSIENDIVNGPATREEKDKFTLSFSELIWGVLRTNINDCIALADIQINNDFVSNDLARKIIYYCTLMIHPGLVQPFPEERIMQIAYTVSMSSGCLSRQVGAVVTNDEYSVLSVGWNSAPKGQLPCTMRELFGLKDPNYMFYDYFSHYETSDKEFCKHCKVLIKNYDEYTQKGDLNGLPLQYCFKDVFTTYSGKNKGNQVHTRSLHAEENAFLQLAKYGSSGIQNGLLFTTDQCCVLCAKKAYQLGIRKIYYIDSYSDIAPSHILQCPDADMADVPELVHYEGAVGPAYGKLYAPFFSQKDEICCRLGMNMKTASESVATHTGDPSNEIDKLKGTTQI